MKKLFFTLLCATMCTASFSFTGVANTFVESAHAVTITEGAANNVNIGGTATNESRNADRNDKLQDFNDSGRFVEVSGAGGEKGVFNTLIRIARDLKNLFFIIASIYFLVIVLRLIFSGNTEEEIGKFKKEFFGLLLVSLGCK